MAMSMMTLLTVMATANDSSEGSWSHGKMTAGGQKLTGIGIKKSLGGRYLNYVTAIRAR